ncbi:MAG: efflux RND transporter periplasmic adaptor subunit [Prolixibacteraceae bacterium]
MGNRKKISLLIIIAVVIVAIAVIVYFSKIFVPSVIRPGSFSTEVVTKGEVVATIEATGVVESENEVLLLSPASSVIQDILKEPGTRVQEGDIILQLEKENVISDIEQIRDQLEVKRNNLERTRLNARSTRLDLEYDEEVKRLRITSLKSTLADQQQLLEVGGISPARIEQTKQEITLAEKDLQTLKEKNAIRLEQLEKEEKGLLLQIRIQKKDLQDKLSLLEKMDIRAPSSGIILSVSGRRGEKVNADNTLVRMSDLSSFKIIGSVDEQYAEKIKTGTMVLVTVDGEQLEGLIGNVTPVVENNKIQFNVHLKQDDHPNLIANQQVQINIITNYKENVTRLPKPPEFNNNKKLELFVIAGNKAVKKEIDLGIIGNRYYEIQSGLDPGDVVITEGINNLRQLDEIEIEY